MERKKITFDSFIRGSIGCVLVVGILMLVERLSGVLLPFFIAWLIAYMVYPLVKFFQYKLRLKSRIISIFCSLFLITVIGVTLFYLLVPPMISEIGRMNDLLVTYLTNGAGNNVPKSLLLSTLEAYFSGARELFEGLALEQLEKEWKKHPILHLDLNIGKYDVPHSLDDILNKALLEWEAIYGTGVGEVTLALRFAGVVERAYKQTGEGVVILVDEYDKPMLQAIGDKESHVLLRLHRKRE